MFEEELDATKLKSVMDALMSAEKLVNFALTQKEQTQPAPLQSASRQLLLQQSDPCDACKAAALCYSLACEEGKMITDGKFKDCAAAKGKCDVCFPASACGRLPPGSTRSPTFQPMPPWVGCADKSEKEVSQAAKAFGKQSYSCALAYRDGACSLAIAAKLCPVTCNSCRTDFAYLWGILLHI